MIVQSQRFPFPPAPLLGSGARRGSHLLPSAARALGVVAALALALAAASPASAQEASPSQELSALLERLDAEAAELKKLDAELLQGDAGMFDEATLREQIASKRAALTAGLDEVVPLLAQLEGGGDGTPERARIEALQRQLALEWKGEIERLEKLQSALRKKHQQEGADLAALDAQAAEVSTALVAAYQSYAEQLSRMDVLGLDVSADREALADRLDGLAKAVVATIPVVQKQAAALEKRLADSPDDAAVKTELKVAQEKLTRGTDSLRAIADLLADMGRDTTPYRQALIEATGEITADVLSGGVALGLVQRWTEKMRDAAIENGPGFLFKAVVFLAILLFFRVLANITRRVVERAVTNSKLKISQLARSMIVTLAARGVLVLGILVALSQLGVALGPLLAGLGVAGFIIGFALQETLGNFAAGAMILVYRPYDVGDLIEASGVFGKVNAMSLVSTTILTLDNQTLVVPNSAIWGNVIKNVTAQRVRRVDLVFGIGYSDDIPRAEEVLTAILEEHPKVLKDPEPMVKLYNLGDSSVDFVVRPWCETGDYWDVHWDVTREVKMRFDREGIGIPFPQRDVHIYREAAPEAPA